MRATAKIVDPDKAELSLTVVMTVAHWKDLRKQQSVNWPSWEFGSLIGAALDATINHVETAREVNA